jgi:hypothetical protein
MARLVLIWSIRLYTELQNEITAMPSRTVVLLQVQTAGSGLAWSIHLYSELHHEITARPSRTVALLQVRLELACSTYLYSELQHEIPQRWWSKWRFYGTEEDLIWSTHSSLLRGL